MPTFFSTLVAILLVAAAPPADARPQTPPRRAAAPAPRRPSARALAAAKAAFRQGRAYYEAGAYLDAIKEYRRAYALAPLPLLLFNIGQAYRLKGDKARAITAYQRYLKVVSEGSVAEEARNHIAALKLKLQMESVEAAKRRAEADAAAARRKAAEAEAAKKRAEADAAARLEAQRQDTERLKRLAADIAKRNEEKRQAAQKDYERRLAAAGKRGYPLHASGIAAMVTGSVLLAVSGLCIGLVFHAEDKIKKWNSSEDPVWTTDLDQRARDRSVAIRAAIGTAASGVALMVAGVILDQVAAHLRKRAVSAVKRPVTWAPVLGPGRFGVTLQGRF